MHSAGIQNLKDNAWRHTPQGGRVDVGMYGEGAHVIWQIEETGPGIPASDLERVFEPFVRGSRPTEEGTGLGLNLSRRFVELFGGRIWLKSAPGSGSTFRFSVPGLPEHDGVASPERDKRPVVLIVDDDRASVRAGKRIGRGEEPRGESRHLIAAARAM